MSDKDITNTGWIPPHERTPEMLALDSAVFAATPDADVLGEVNLPDVAILCELEKQVNGGKCFPRIRQITGSCVGCGGAMAYLYAMCGDIVVRGDMETPKHVFPFATYGIGRQLGGLRGRGEGSFGSAQAKAVEQWGMLEWDDSRVPKPTIANGWITWTKETELSYSWPPQWPQREPTLRETANKYQVLKVVRIRNTEQAQQAVAQGYGISLASEFGTKPRIVNGVLLGDWVDTWAHQMSCAGYRVHPQLGIIWWIQNQWHDIHGKDPWIQERYGINGGFWIRNEVFKRIIESGEVFAHSGTEGFAAKRKVDWGTFGLELV